jgi:hypothetical protein
VASITISIAPTPVSLMESQVQQFTVTLTGTINTAVTWSLNPAIGTINSYGQYTAPAMISSAQAVTVTATSVADTTQSASATVNLVPVSISLTPTTATLTASQTQQFTPTVTGAGNGAVTWSLSPAVGTISNGLYTAPAQISSSQSVTIIATSVADATKSASAIVSLHPPASTVSVSLSPVSINLQASQTQQFSATVTGTSNSAVTWTLSTPVGTISNGLYTAPASVSSSQIVMVTATSVADPTKSAFAQVNLQATIAVSITPASVSLQASQAQQFTPSVTGTSNTAVTWSLNPSVGTISSSGLYTAPATITSLQQVVVMATSSANTAEVGQVTVTLNPPAGPPPVTLPVEIMGPAGTLVSSLVNVPTVPAGSNRMQMRVHGLKYETEASVQVNGSAWVPLNTATVTLLGNAAACGGIGGGFSTLDLTVPLASGAIIAGNNTINFRFNGTDGTTSGFRVLSFNFLDPNGNSLVPPSAFVQDDPTTWQPPLNDPTDIAAGQALWRGAALTVPQSTGPVPIRANCMSCHTQDGRDLKYFNYSNYSIVARSVFHGLTALQGNQIASYIRTLSVNNPGRPWNPPYQPGPGLDSLPVNEWAAGAGLDAVAASDQDQLNDIFPAGVQNSVFSAQGTINPREIRVTFQLLDWNQWLPTVHPLDAFGAAFTSSAYYTTYLALRAGLKVGDAASYITQKYVFQNWPGQRYNFYGMFVPNPTPAGFWTEQTTNEMHSINLWGLVKSWELNNEFQLEGLSQAFYGPQGSPRAWTGNFPFMASPNIDQIPPTYLKNGLQSTHDYLGFVWYHTQLILNDSNKQQDGSSPIDWGYGLGQLSRMAGMVYPAESLFYEWQIRGLQISNNGIGPQVPYAGWNWGVNPISPAIDTGDANIWVGVPQATRTALYQGYLSSWLAVVSTFTPQQFYAGTNGVTASQVPTLGQDDTGRFIDTVFYAIPQYRYWGVNQTLINQLAAWAQTVWPLANWAATTTATCYRSNPVTVICSTQ